MRSKLVLSNQRLHIFHEIRKKRIFVGELQYIKDRDQYALIYDDKYLNLKKAIPISPDLDLFKKKHLSSKGKLFLALQDRIPSRENPAYEDYCYSQKVSVNETNPIVLLRTIGKRGPSSFVFEPVYENVFSVTDIKKFRDELGISQSDLALAFDISKVTLQKIESGESTDSNTIRRIQICLEFPDVALWQLLQTGSKVHSNVLSRLKQYFRVGV